MDFFWKQWFHYYLKKSTGLELANWLKLFYYPLTNATYFRFNFYQFFFNVIISKLEKDLLL